MPATGPRRHRNRRPHGARPAVGPDEDAHPRRFVDRDCLASIAATIYGGSADFGNADIAQIVGHQLAAGSRRGYLYQLLAGSVWSSLFALPAIRQPTLIVAGTDDPIIPIINAHIMARLLPHATLHTHTPAATSTCSPTRPHSARSSRTSSRPNAFGRSRRRGLRIDGWLAGRRRVECAQNPMASRMRTTVPRPGTSSRPLIRIFEIVLRTP